MQYRVRNSLIGIPHIEIVYVIRVRRRTVQNKSTHDAAAAYGYAFLDGLNQAALDYVGSIPGISKIGETLTKNIKNPVLKFLGNMGEEALTEDAQSVLENGLKSIILGEDADASPFSEEAMYSALLGALSAGILNGPQTVLEAGRTVSVGNSFITEGKIGDAIKIGLSNVKSSEEYQTAAKMEKELNAGKNPSAYRLGALVIQSMSDTAMTARNIDETVRESAQNTGVSDDVAETVAAVAVRFSKKVCFVPSDAAILQADGGNGGVAGTAAAVGAYDSASDTIFLNAGVSNESATEFVLKHELTHGIEKTSMWKSLRRVARQQMGDAAFDAEVSRIRSRRAAVGETLDTAGAEKEVVANFVGNNLFTENFAEAITRQDTKLSSVFAGTFYRLRYAMDAIRNGRQAARMQYAERLFTAALDKTPGTVQLGADGNAEGEVQYQLDENFGEQLQDWLEGNGKAHGSFNGEYFVLGTTPDILIKHGAKNVPVTMYPECVEKVAGGKGDFGHDIDLNELAELPAELNNPVLLFRGSVPNSLVALTELKNKNGHDIIAAIHCSAYEGRTEITKIASVYSKTNARNENKILGYVDKQVQRGNLVDGNIEKASRWFTRQGLQLPELVQTTLEANTTVSQNTGDVNSQYMQNSENDARNDARGGVQHSFIRDEDGNTVVKADRDVLSGNDRNEWRRQVSAFFNDVLLKDGSLTVESTEGQTLRITKKETLHKNRDRYKQEKGKRVLLSDNEFFVKMQALSHVDELAQVAELRKDAEGNVAVWKDTKNHPFAADGFVYSDVLFENADGTRYVVTMSIGMKDGVGTVYNVGKIKGPMQRQTPQKSRTSDRFVGSRRENSGSMHTSVSDITVSQNTGDVNSQYMQNSENDARGNTQHAFADDADGGVAVEEKAKTDGKVQPDADAYTKYRDDTLAPGRVMKALQDTSDADAIGEVKQKAEAEETKRRTKFQKKQEAELGDLLRRFKNGAISEEEYKSEQARLIDEAVAENDRKWKSGNRGPAAIREMLGSDNRYMRENYIQKEVEQERQERREKAAVAEEKKEKTALKNKVIRLMDEAKDRLAHPQKNRHIPLQHTQTIIDLLQAITVAEEEKQRYIAAAREKLGDAVYPATKTRFENQIKKAMDSGDAVSRQLDRLAMEYKELQKSDTMKCAYAPELDAVISGFAESIRGKTLSDMTAEEMNTAADRGGGGRHCAGHDCGDPSEHRQGSASGQEFSDVFLRSHRHIQHARRLAQKFPLVEARQQHCAGVDLSRNGGCRQIQRAVPRCCAGQGFSKGDGIQSEKHGGRDRTCGRRRKRGFDFARDDACPVCTPRLQFQP